MSATTTHSGIEREIALAQSERTARSIHRQACELHRLNTAAPDLLAALERIVGEHADLGEVDLSNDERDALDQARAATP
jgi:hypothetical protein